MSQYNSKRSAPSSSRHCVQQSPLAVLLAIVMLSISCGRLHAQSQNFDNFGTEFYVAFGPNEGGQTGFPPETQNVMDLYITSHVVAHGAVEVPKLNFYQTFTTTPGQITTIVLPNGNNFGQTVEVTEDQVVLPGMSVHITSDSEVAVFGMNHKEYSSDAFMGFPTKVLGTEYRTMNYPTSNNGGDLLPGMFLVVGVVDSTNVTITLQNASTRSPAGTPITVRLDKGDVYLVEGTSNMNDDLTGSLIESDYPVAVFSGHHRTAIPDTAVNIDGAPSRDHLVEQLPPVSAWGDSALVVPYASSTLPDLVRVVCSEDSTQITINGNPLPNTYNAGQFYEITHLPGVTSIQASKPIEVGQYMHTSLGGLDDPRFPAYGDPALALVYPVEQFKNSYTIISVVNADAFTGNFVNIVADASSISTMMIDGIPISSAEFHPIPNTRFDYAQHPLTQGTHNLSGSLPFGVTVYALGPVDSYSYVGGTLLKTITPLETVGLVIDFGDRVLAAADLVAPYPRNPNDTFDTTVVLKNISEDTVNIYSFPKRIQDTDRFYVVATTPPSGAPAGTAPVLTIPPLGVDSFTIQFWPHEINRRMHTQITANTDHLRAYVVDVYGRGVMDNMGIFADTNKTITIDTLDFGTFQNTDPPGDSEVFVGNAGTAAMYVSTAALSTPGTIFTEPGISYGGASVTTPFTIAEPPSGAARVDLQFNPTGLANGLFSDSLVIESKSSKHMVVLIGHVETITALAPGVDSVTWGSTRVCENAVFDIPVNNPNNVPITITSANIIGANSTDFALSTRTPLIIPPGHTDTVQVNFIPTAGGTRTAQAILAYNLPKNAPIDTVQLLGTGDKPTLELAAQQNVHGYILDPYFLMPIYAKTNMGIIGCDGYHIYLTYDSVNLKLLDVITARTLTPQGYISIQSSTPPGHDTINFQQGGEASAVESAIITGGGCDGSDSGCIPLVYLQFQPVLSGAEDPADASPITFEKGFPINFTMTFDDAQLPYSCSDHIFDSGYAVIGPVCDTQFIEPQPLVPLAMMLGTPIPNPSGIATSNSSTTIQYDIDTTIAVRIDLVDAQGNQVQTLVNEQKLPGYYNATVDPAKLPSGLYYVRMIAGNYIRIRNLVIQK